jgi:hypothetical protein
MTRDVDAALLEIFGPAEPAREAMRRAKGENMMKVRPDDGRRKRATGRTTQFNVMMKPNVKEAIAKAAHKAGVPVTVWIEQAALAYMGAKP